MAQMKSGVHRVPNSLFSLFLSVVILKQDTTEESDHIVESIDIDQDGYVGKDDLETFINRSSLYKKSPKVPLTSPKGKAKLYPTEPLSEKDVINLLKELQVIMKNRNLNSHELFFKLDANEDGFLTIDEFCPGIEQIIPIPRAITEGFFAYIDKLKIGLIDMENFLHVMKKSIWVRERVRYSPLCFY